VPKTRAWKSRPHYDGVVDAKCVSDRESRLFCNGIVGDVASAQTTICWLGGHIDPKVSLGTGLALFGRQLMVSYGVRDEEGSS
jgi:hypothetical protein